MLDQRKSRWAGVVQMLCKCFVFAGMVLSYVALLWTIWPYILLDPQRGAIRESHCQVNSPRPT